MRRLFFIGLILSLYACDGTIKTQREIITGMEHAVVKNSSDEFLRPLVANYLNYYQEYKDDEMTPIYLYRCAVLYYRALNYKEAAILLETILREYPNTEILEDTYLTLAMINATKISDPKRAKALFDEYLEKFPNGKGQARVERFFLPEEEKIQQRIERLLTENSSLPRGKAPNKGKLNELVFAYANYVKAAPDAPLSPSYCLMGARLAIQLELHLVAVQLLEKIYHDYPDFSQYPDALLLLAVEYDTNILLYLRQGNVISSPINDRVSEATLKQMDVVAHGGKLYQELIDRFPDHDAAQSARTGLKFLGQKTNKVVEEFIRIQDSIQAATPQ